MNIIRGLQKRVPFSGPTAVAIGNFDGIHLGHQKILQRLVREATQHRLHPLVLTFSPHPEKVLGEKRIRMIQTFEQRLREVEKFQVQTVLAVAFDEQFAGFSALNFIQNIIVGLLKAKIIVVGENFQFGKGQEGDISLLRRIAAPLKFQVISIPAVKKNGMPVSSSLVRRFLQAGEVEKANLLLGRPYEIEGKVIEGKSRGKPLGFPTANIETTNEIIPRGVFITRTSIGAEAFPSMTNVGIRPTFDQDETQVESHLIGFNGNLYGKEIRIRFLKKIRAEVKFQALQELRQQLEKDLETAKVYFGLQ